jgi:hypothetical protein
VEYNFNKLDSKGRKMIETIKELYKEPICNFFKDIKDINVDEMPIINIPSIGCGYEKTHIKIAIFGEETRASNYKEFSEVKNNYDNNIINWEVIFDRLVEPFSNMEFVEYTDKCYFNIFVLMFLAEFYKDKLGFDWQHWEELKNKKNYSDILQSFILGNINSFEKYKNGVKKVKSESRNINKSDWIKVKEASEFHFDSKLKNVIDICKPDLLLILHWGFNLKKCLDRHYKKNEWSDRTNDSNDKWFFCAHVETKTINTLVYKVDHPRHMKGNEESLDKIIQIFAEKILRIMEHLKIEIKK